MVVHYLYVFSAGSRPAKTDAPLIIDTDAVLAGSGDGRPRQRGSVDRDRQAQGNLLLGTESAKNELLSRAWGCAHAQRRAAWHPPVQTFALVPFRPQQELRDGNPGIEAQGKT